MSGLIHSISISGQTESRELGVFWKNISGAISGNTELTTTINAAKLESEIASSAYTEERITIEKQERESTDEILSGKLESVESSLTTKLSKSDSPNTIYGVDDNGNQIQYVAGEGIQIDDGIIRATGGSITGISWGDIQGDIDDQEDLKDKFDTISGSIVSHVNNSVIHVTNEDKTKWNAAEENARGYASAYTDTQINTLSGNVVSTLNSKADKSDTYTKSEVDAKVAAKISYKVVTVLPSSGETNVIYLVPSTQSGVTEDVYDEYMWIDSKWEKIGSTKSDISSKIDKVTGATVDNLATFVSGGNIADSGKKFVTSVAAAASANDNNIATEKAVRTELELKADKSDTYTKVEVNEQIDTLSGNVVTAIDTAKIEAESSACAYTDTKVSEKVTIVESANTIYGNDNTGNPIMISAGYNIIIANGKISAENAPSGKTYESGIGITIDTENKINANSEAETVDEIVIAGGPISAQGIWEDNKIPSGTSIQEILTKLLCKELYPNAATKPSISLAGDSINSYYRIGNTITIPAVSMNKSNGKFNASYTSPSQPSVEGVTWSNEQINPTVTKFSGVTINSGTTSIAAVSNVTVELGENKVVYSSSANYSEPSNMPVTNLNHSTRSTSSVSTSSTEYSAIWQAGSSTPSKTISTKGVYPIYTNMDGTTTIKEECDVELVKGAVTEVIISGGSEVTQSRHFMTDIPSGRTFSGLYAYNTMTKSWDKQDESAYEIINDGTIKHTINGTEYEYIRISKTGAYVGATTWKFVWNTSLDK